MLRQIDDVHATLALYSTLTSHGVYLRPTDKGLTALALDPDAPKFIGAGQLNSVPPAAGIVERNVAEYRRKLAGAVGRNPEEQFSLQLLRFALANGLQLPGSDLLLIVQEWRFPSSSIGGRFDVLAVDANSGQLVVIELKQQLGDGSGASAQASQYLDLLHDHRAELASFFGQLFEAMKGLYDADGQLTDVSVNVAIPPRAEVWAPEGRIVVEGVQPTASTGGGLGPQVAGDDAFRARVRRHQSWCRDERLRAPWGTGPTRNADRELGNMLTASDAEVGMNFFTEGIHAVARRRIGEGGGVEPFPCTHNLLSSQPMCFNLFGPFVEDHELALAMLQPLIPVAASAITDVRIEYAPQPANEYLDDRTAFDAFIEFVDERGEPAFVGIETKLTEPFSQQRYDTPTYRALTEAVNSPWTSSPAELADPRWNHLWRNQLLVEATRRHSRRLHGARGWLAVVVHPEDPGITSTISAYRRFLLEDTSLLEWPLDRVVRTFLQAASTAEHRAWLADFEDRYLNLHLSS